MGGKEAREGFWFQDAKAIGRLLEDAIDRRRRALLGIEEEAELRVRVESPVLLTALEEEQLDGEDAADQPLWDGTFAHGDIVTVEECKLGGVSRDDRITFYRRLRATIATPVSIDRLAARITVGRDAEGLEIWRQLATVSQDEEPATDLVPYVDTSEKLAAEALYYLTVANPRWRRKDRPGSDQGVPATPPLSLPDARALLSRFALDDSQTLAEVEVQLSTQLSAIGASFTMQSLKDQLRGFIDRKAREVVPAELTAASVIAELELAARYLAIPPATEALWHRLRTAEPPSIASTVEVQPWRETQAHVATLLAEGNSGRVAFTSDGGGGKSFLLAQLHAEATGLKLWVELAAPLDQLEAALDAGVWAATNDGTPLSIFVDAVELHSAPAVLLGAIHRACRSAPAARVLVGMRRATWNEFRNQLASWREISLQRWDEERVRPLAQGKRTDALSSDLVDLLRTPLLLEFFLQTFGTNDPIPTGIGTRHGVLRAYFERRVLANGHPDAHDRRTALDRGVEAALGNNASWRDSGRAAQQLVSEGVLVGVLGTLRFRHTLLRDFAVGMQLSLMRATDIAGALLCVTSPIIRHELLRGLIEAVVDPAPLIGGPPIADLIRECATAGVAPGIALGATDVRTGRLLDAIGPIDDGSVLRQAVIHSQLIDNRAWLSAPLQLDPGRPEWLGHTQVEALARLADFALAVNDANASELAIVLRQWTLGHVVRDEGPWTIMAIGRLLAKTQPNDETLAWYGRLELGPNPWLHELLQQVRDIAAGTSASDAALDQLIARVLLSDSTILHRGNAIWEVMHLFLSDRDKAQGLLSTRPRSALDLLFALSVMDEEDKQRRRRKDLDVDAFAARWHAATFPDGIPTDPEEDALELKPTLSMEEASGDLVDDAPSIYGGRQDEIGTVMSLVSGRAAVPAFATHLARSAIASRSAHARILALEAPRSPDVDNAVLEILRDRRVYHVRYASQALWEAIARHWSELNDETRSMIEANILERARSPLMDVATVGTLASAIPRDQLPASLTPYVEFLERRGRATRPAQPSRMRSFSERDDREPRMPPGVANDITEKWRELRDLARIEGAGPEVTRSLLRTIELANAPGWLWETIRTVLNRSRMKKENVLDAPVAKRLFDAAIARAGSEPARAEPSDWGTAINVAEYCCASADASDGTGMRAQLMREVVAGAGERAHNIEHAMQALMWIDTQSWFVNADSRSVYERWFRDELSLEALETALHLLVGLDLSTALSLLRHVLETPNRLGDDPTLAHSFSRDVGAMLASGALWLEASVVRDVIATWCAGNRNGALADASTWRELLSGYGFGLQESVRTVDDQPFTRQGLRRLVPLFTSAWDAWIRCEDDGSLSFAIARPLDEDFSSKLPPPEGSWFVALAPLLARIISEGSRGDLGALLNVAWATARQETIEPIAGVLVERAQRERLSTRGDDWVFTSLTDLLKRVGLHARITREGAERVLACLYRVGEVAPRAIAAAHEVEQAIRDRDRAPSD